MTPLIHRMSQLVRTGLLSKYVANNIASLASITTITTQTKECRRLFLPSLSILAKTNDHSNRKYCIYSDHMDNTYFTLGKGDLEEVMPIIRNYYLPYEAISMGLVSIFQEMNSFLESSASRYLESDFCVGARNHEGKLIGLVLAEHQIKEVSDMDESAIFAEENIILGRTLEIINLVEGIYDIFSKYGFSEVLHISPGFVAPSYSGQGIGRKVQELVEQKAVEKGIRVAYGIASGIVMQNIMQTHGYEAIYEIPYRNFGFLNLKDMGNDTCIKVMVKQLV